MPRLPQAVVERVARFVLRPLLASPLAIQRAGVELLGLLNRAPEGVVSTRQARGGSAGELVALGGSPGPARILFIHGGGYECASAASYRNVAGALALRAGYPVFSLEYRLAPEHPAPAALEDALAGALALEDPVCTPPGGELSRLPPTLIHAASREMLLSDAQELARRAGEAGTDVQLRVFDGLWHDFHIHAGMLRVADDALEHVAEFLAEHLRSA